MFEFLGEETGLSILFASFVVLLFLVPILVAMWEKRLVWNYMPVDRNDPESMRGLTDFAFVDRIGGGIESLVGHGETPFVAGVS